MTSDLEKTLKDRWQGFTAAEQQIAAYLLQNLGGIPFETAASLSRRVGVSAMTVGRFLRKLGYAGVDELKQELRGDPAWLRLYRNPVPSRDADAPNEILEGEIRALSDVHALPHGDEWQAVVELLANAERVSVASFQLGRFLGITFASLLENVRPGVSFVSGVDGAYADILVDPGDNRCVVLIDRQRYSKHFKILARAVAEQGIPLIIITDTQCYWARQLTPHVLMVAMQGERAWHNFSAFSGLFSLLLSEVISARGDAVYERVQHIVAMRERFIGFSEQTRMPAPPATAADDREPEP